jgi:ethanolamine permease
MSSPGELKRVLKPTHLWAIAVGLVISGDYVGWNTGLASSGALGLIIATLGVTVLYVCFIFSFTELTTAIPNAGGPFAYAHRAFGRDAAFVAGAATLIEFVFAPPAIALAIGAYLAVQFPGIDPKLAATGAYVVFAALNICGVSIAANFELAVTLLAIIELCVFMGVVSPGFSWAAFQAHGWAGESHPGPHLIGGMFAAIPFAIWFFLAIEGVAMAAEEAKSPRVIPVAYIAGILTLLALAFGVMIFAGGVGDWRKISNINDPLPQAMKIVVGAKSGWLPMLVWLGLFGLVASFHGIILGYSRQMFALSRAGYLPAVLARLHPRFRTPHIAILAGAVIGVIAVYGDSFLNIAHQSLTAAIVTLSVFGALTAYVVSMASLFRLRRAEPALARSYRAPAYPFAPGLALILAVICLVAMAWLNTEIFAVFAAIIMGGYGLYRVVGRT